MLIMGLVAEKAFAAAKGIAAMAATIKVAQTTQLGLNTAMKGFLPFMVFYAAYKGTEFLTSWADGTRQVKAETAALTESLKLETQTLKGAEAAAAKKGETQRLYEEAYTKQYMEDIRRLAAADDARTAADRSKKARRCHEKAGGCRQKGPDELGQGKGNYRQIRARKGDGAAR
jgi:hypothetical protein